MADSAAGPVVADSAEDLAPEVPVGVAVDLAAGPAAAASRAVADSRARTPVQRAAEAVANA